MSMNIVTSIFGSFLLYLSILASQAKSGGSYASIIVAVGGSLAIAVSLVGYWGMAQNSRLLLIAHCFFLMLIGVLVLLGGILCFVLENQAVKYLEKNWEFVNNKVINVSKQEAYDTLSSHVLVIGLACFLLVACLLYNLLASTAAIRAINQDREFDEEALPTYKKLLKKNGVKKNRKDESTCEEEESEEETEEESEESEDSETSSESDSSSTEEDEKDRYRQHGRTKISKKGTKRAINENPKESLVRNSGKVGRERRESRNTTSLERSKSTTDEKINEKKSSSECDFPKGSEGQKGGLLGAIERAQENWRKRFLFGTQTNTIEGNAQLKNAIESEMVVKEEKVLQKREESTNRNSPDKILKGTGDFQEGEERRRKVSEKENEKKYDMEIGKRMEIHTNNGTKVDRNLKEASEGRWFEKETKTASEKGRGRDERVVRSNRRDREGESDREGEWETAGGREREGRGEVCVDDESLENAEFAVKKPAWERGKGWGTSSGGTSGNKMGKEGKKGRKEGERRGNFFDSKAVDMDEDIV